MREAHRLVRKSRILDHRGVVDDGWHPLSGLPAPEYVPAQWNGPHVGRRLIEGFRTLARVPVERGPGPPATAWPLYVLEFREYYAALVGDDRAEYATVAAERNRVRLPASAEDIARMEAVISWPARYLADCRIARVVLFVAARRARDWPMERIAQKLRRSAGYVRRCNRAGLDEIAAGLRRDAVVVF
jgi:hypothetical protein